MATSPLTEIPEFRFAPYIQELRDFFVTAHLSFGSPEDLAIIAALLAEPGPVAEDLGSLVRSIVLREGGAMPHAELLEVLSFAIAGPELKHSPDLYQQPLRQLVAFVSNLMRRPWSVPPNQPGDVVPFPSPAAADEPTLAFSDPLQTPRSAQADATRQSQPTSAEFSHTPSAIGVALADRHRDSTAQHAETGPSLNLESDLATEPSSVPAIHQGHHPPHRRLALPLSLAGIAAAALVAALVWKATRPMAVYRIEPVPAAALAPAPSSSVVPTPALAPLQPPQPPMTPHHSAQPQDSAAGTLHRKSATADVAPPPERATHPAQFAAAPAPPPVNSRQYTSNPTRFGHIDPVSPSADELRPSSPSAPGSRPLSRFTVSSGIMASNIISAPDPTYPTLARLAHVRGEVILQAVVARDGTISATRVLRGPRLLRAAAQEAVRRWRYRPYRIDGQPVDVATIITVDFHDAS